MHTSSPYYRNIKLFYFIYFFSWLTFFGAVFVFFYKDIALTYTQVLIVISSRSIAGLIFEVPSGAIGDLCGRKRSLQFAFILKIVGFSYLFTSANFFEALIANAIIGVADAFSSGSDMALVYDSLLECKLGNLYRSVQSQLVFLRYTAIASASFLTGYAIKVGGVRMPIALTVCSFVISFALSAFLVEPPLLTKKTDRQYFRHMRESAKYICKERDVLYAILFGGLFWAGSLASHTLQQAFLIDVGVSVENIGLLTGAYVMLAALTARTNVPFSKVFESRFSLGLARFNRGKPSSNLGEFMFALILLCVGFIGTGLAISPFLGIFFIAVGQCAQGMEQVSIKHFLNMRLRSHDRATSLSFDGLVSSLLLVLMLPVVGLVADAFGSKMAFFLLGLFLCVFCGSALWMFRKHSSAL